MMKNWENAKFQENAGSLSHENRESALSFSLGSVSRQGFEHIPRGISNQDAVSLFINDNLIIGVLCDGCSSNHRLSINEYSNNQVGANILAQLTTNICSELLTKRKNRIKPDVFLRVLSETIQQRLAKVIKTLGISSKDGLFSTRNLFSSTIVGFVITSKEYIVFHCGDGVISLNGQTKILSNDEGQYLSEGLFNPNASPTIKLAAYNILENLESLCLMSDGFEIPEILESQAFHSLVNSKSQNNVKGYFDLIPEFHLTFLNKLFSEKINLPSNWPGDDATMILVKRINND